MSAMVQKWKNMTVRQRVMVLAAGVLIVVVLAQYVSFEGLALPTASRIEDARDTLKSKQERRAELEQRHHVRERSLDRLRASAEPYFWRIGERTPTMEIQAELEKIAGNAHVGINTRNPRTREVSEHVRNVEIYLNLTGTMREISRFLGEVDRSKRRLFWSHCDLRRRKVRNDERIFLNGRISAYFFSGDAEQLLFTSGDGGQQVTSM